MPYDIKKVKKGCYEVINTESGVVKSKCTSLKKAKAQMRLLYGIESGKWKPTGKKGGEVVEDELGLGVNTEETLMGSGVECRPIILDGPLMIRLLEWAREDVKADVPLHVATENMMKILSHTDTLTMKDYSDIIAQKEGGLLDPEHIKKCCVSDPSIKYKKGMIGPCPDKMKYICGGKIISHNKDMTTWKQFWADKCKGKKFGSRQAINEAMKQAASEWRKKKGGEKGAGSEPLLLGHDLGKSSTNMTVLPPRPKSICKK